MTLELQLSTLAGLGLPLDDGITVDDVLTSFSRADYERVPFDLVLFVLGIEVERAPWGRPMCSRVWNFDTECVGATGDYVRIVKTLCRVSDQPDRLADVVDFVDIEGGRAWLRYNVDGVERIVDVEVDDDWADVIALNQVVADLQGDGRRFYFKDNGQSGVMFYLDARTATELNRLSGNALKPVLADESNV